MQIWEDFAILEYVPFSSPYTTGVIRRAAGAPPVKPL